MATKKKDTKKPTSKFMQPMKISSELLGIKGFKNYNLWIIILAIGTLLIFIFFISSIFFI